MKRLRASLTLAAGLAIAMSTNAGAASTSRVDNKVVQPFTGPTVDKSVALVQLKGDPLSTYVKTKPTSGKKIDFNNSTSKSYRAQLSALRNDYKQWLHANAPKAKITGSWDLALNAVAVQLNGTTLAKVGSAPQVKHAEYEGLYHPDTATTGNIDLDLINAAPAYSLTGGAPNAGAGIKVGVVDTGIDINHPCFSDAGYASQQQLGDTHFTNNKVIVARVFYNKQPGRFTPEALQEHGTHVAGTIACDYQTPATVDGASVPSGVSGVAPAALLGSYVVFPGNETDGITNARSEDILNALEAAYNDGMDIVNMSLGGGASGFQDLLTNAVNDLDTANMVVAVAAGNSALGDSTEPHTQAPGHYTVESPGSAARALTAGAFSVGHSVESLVLQGSNTYGSQDGDFTFPTSDLTAPGVATPQGVIPAVPVGTLLDGCGAYSTMVTGDIVLVARGTCTFGEKVARAEAAGAVGVIIVNRDPLAIPMAADDLFPATIPAVNVALNDGLALLAGLPSNITITAPRYVSQDDPSTAAFAPLSNLQADFSSQGPTDADFRVKPDVMAPGVNVLSSVPEWDCDHTIDTDCFAFFQGTSMATPHLAGSAAVIKGLHPTWSAWEIRSAIVNTADQDVIKTIDGSDIQTDVNIVGNGRENLGAATTTWVAIDPVSVSFGAVPSGAGQTQGFTVTIKNEMATGHTFDLAVTASTGTGVSYRTSVSSITLAAHASGTFTVWMTASKGASAGGHQAKLVISGSSVVYARAVVYTLIK